MTYKQQAQINTFIGIIFIILILLLVAIYKAKQVYAYYNPPLISPCVGDCRGYNIVISDMTYDWSDIVTDIVEEFKDLGKKTTMEAIQIAYCESRWEESALNTKNKNGTWDGGVFQFNSIHKYTTEKVFNAKENIRLAKQMYLRNHRSWGAWSCARKLGLK